jgi:putative GTP pyrophosphokinase
MSENPEVKKAVALYKERRVLYEALAKKVESVVRDILDTRGINYYSINSRAKSVESFEGKASKGNYKDPLSDIKDMAGVRVITYTDADAKAVSIAIQELFEIRPEQTVDKSEELGTDRMGYRSIHCVGTLGDKRSGLPENKVFEGMYFEIQVRTILQHAWAEFEHDRNYKFSGVLPKDIKRRLSIIAGNLELADREFDSISKAIDDYVLEVNRKTESGDLSIPINSNSLFIYLSEKLKPLIEAGFLQPSFAGLDKEIIGELKAMNVTTLEELNRQIPDNFVEKAFPCYKQIAQSHKFFLVGPIRDFLIIKNSKGYFEKAWQHHFNIFTKESVPFYKQYGINLQKLGQEYGFTIG